MIVLDGDCVVVCVIVFEGDCVCVCVIVLDGDWVCVVEGVDVTPQGLQIQAF